MAEGDGRITLRRYVFLWFGLNPSSVSKKNLTDFKTLNALLLEGSIFFRLQAKGGDTFSVGSGTRAFADLWSTEYQSIPGQTPISNFIKIRPSILVSRHTDITCIFLAHFIDIGLSTNA
ncbi:hypothetical protein L798_06856 [Zootermopsis nevadensis]|uniref:Uncharacterized protein n=1 Tax=Zootermopsis nevadensis TaxID=136037 RepID=A0A067QRZ6_ZOONE|nr:hypothetical protein L798_06856 [Zootermopsis nevadensis]